MPDNETDFSGGFGEFEATLTARRRFSGSRWRSLFATSFRADVRFSCSLQLGSDEPTRFRRLGLGCTGVETGPSSEHGLFYLFGDDWAYAAQILPDRVHLEDRPHEVLVIPFDFADLPVSGYFTRIESLAHRVPDEDFLLPLAVTVDPAVTLLHDVGIPRNFYMDQVVAMILKIDSFRSGVGRQQNPNRGYVRIRLKGRLDGFAFVGAHASVQDGETIPSVPVGRENLMEPDMGGAVFGEEDDSLFVPVPVRF